MKKLCALLLMMVIPAVSYADKPLGAEEYKSIDDLAAMISSYFPKVQGEVTSVQGELVTIALGKKDGLAPGMSLTLWRAGKEIVHPVTGAVIGHEEEEVGAVDVTEVGDSSSTAAVTKKIEDPKKGDRARITPKKISIALIPVRSDRIEVISALAQRLGESGRFSVLDAAKVDAFLKDKKQRDETLVKEMGRAFSLDVVAAVGVYPSEGKLLVTTRLFYPDDSRPFETLVAMLDPRYQKQPLGEVRPFFAPVKEKVESTAELSFAARYFAVADLDGDGKLEYVFSDGTRLHIYRLEPAGWHEVWTEAAPPSTSDVQHIYLDAADVNGDGKPQIFVTSMVDGRIVSSVVAFKDGSYRRIAELPVFLRVLSYPGRGVMLIGQDYDPVTFFSGRPKQYVWSDGKFVPGAEFALPKGVNLYGFTFADFGEPNLLLVAIDESSHLQVYSRDTVIWKSEERYPEVDTIVYKPVTGVDAVLAKQAYERDKAHRVFIRGRVMALDIDGNGKDEVLVPKNIPGLLFGGFKDAEMDDLGWTGARLEQRWNIKDIPGAVLDYQILRDEKGDVQILALVKTGGGLFSKQGARVIVYQAK